MVTNVKEKGKVSLLIDRLNLNNTFSEDDKSAAIILFVYHYKQNIDPYWPHDVGDSLTLDDFKIKTEAVDKSVDYITRIMSVSRGVSWIFL